MSKAILRLTILLLIMISCVASADNSVPSAERLPLGHWSYDAMARLAADGLVPGMSARVFMGDRLFTRLEMADVLADVTAKLDQADAQDRALIGKLMRELTPELEVVAPDVFAASPEFTREAFVLGQVKAVAGEHSGDRGNAVLTGFADLSPHIFAMLSYNDNREVFFHKTAGGTDPDKAIIAGFDEGFSWALGREYQNWGESYMGSLILSGNSGGFVQARASKDIDFGKFLGNIKITQSVSEFEDEGKTLYLLARRYERPVSSHLYLGMNETAKTNTTPNPLELIMPFYLYQHIFVDDVDAETNVLASADLLYRAGNGVEWYGEWLVDDMSSPTIFGRDFSRPQKTGLTLGFYTPKVFAGDRLSTFRAEYSTIDRETYSATRESVPELAYTHNSMIIGSPIGPNATALYLRDEQYLSDKFSVITEYLNRQQKDSSPPARGSERVLSFLASYDISNDKSISLRVAPFKTVSPAGSEDSGTAYELRALFAF